MKTKNLQSAFILLTFALFTTFSLFSCSDDDEEKGNDEYSLIGTWKYTFDGPSDYVLLTFYLDGTGKSVEFDDGEIDGDDSFRFSYAENKLTVYWEDGYKETINISWKNKNKFTTSWYDEVDTWIRQ